MQWLKEVYSERCNGSYNHKPRKTWNTWKLMLLIRTVSFEGLYTVASLQTFSHISLFLTFLMNLSTCGQNTLTPPYTYTCTVIFLNLTFYLFIFWLYVKYGLFVYLPIWRRFSLDYRLPFVVYDQNRHNTSLCYSDEWKESIPLFAAPRFKNLHVESGIISTLPLSVF